MCHGDDQGLVLPPRVAPLQVVIIPIVTKTVRYEGCRPDRSVVLWWSWLQCLESVVVAALGYAAAVVSVNNVKIRPAAY